MLCLDVTTYSGNKIESNQMFIHGTIMDAIINFHLTWIRAIDIPQMKKNDVALCERM